MGIEITIRHIEVSADCKAYVRSKAEELMNEFPNVENIHVIADGHGHRMLAEIVVQGKPHLRIEASGAADAILPAFDMAFDKTLSQLRKAIKKVQEHRV
ncbi:MAG: HPF/RaiA family ribosome-associated protein [bacterium]